jgi:hypothetical protein
VFRKAAADAEAAIKKSGRFNTVSVNDLATWVPDYAYDSQDDTHKKMVKEYYDFSAIRESIDSPDSMKPGQEFCELPTESKDRSTRELAELHAVIAYSLWTTLIPYYVKERTKLGTRGKHWRPLEKTSPIRTNRLDVYNLVKPLKASDHIAGAPADAGLLDFYDWNLEKPELPHIRPELPMPDLRFA